MKRIGVSRWCSDEQRRLSARAALASCERRAREGLVNEVNEEGGEV